MAKRSKKNWYSNFCVYKSQEERKEAGVYLKLWKKYFIAKLPERLKIKEEKWIENKELPSIGLKFCIDNLDKSKKKELKKVGESLLSYDDVIYDIDGWADAKKYAPEQFDLVLIQTDNKTVNGWHTGEEWYSLRLRDYDDVLYWKRRKEAY